MLKIFFFKYIVYLIMVFTQIWLRVKEGQLFIYLFLISAVITIRRASQVCQWQRICLPSRRYLPRRDACQAGDPGSILMSGRSPGEGNDSSLQNSCLGNPMDKGTWQAAIHVVAKSWT